MEVAKLTVSANPRGPTSGRPRADQRLCAPPLSRLIIIDNYFPLWQNINYHSASSLEDGLLKLLRRLPQSLLAALLTSAGESEVPIEAEEESAWKQCKVSPNCTVFNTDCLPPVAFPHCCDPRASCSRAARLESVFPPRTVQCIECSPLGRERVGGAHAQREPNNSGAHLASITQTRASPNRWRLDAARALLRPFVRLGGQQLDGRPFGSQRDGEPAEKRETSSQAAPMDSPQSVGRPSRARETERERLVSALRIEQKRSLIVCFAPSEQFFNLFLSQVRRPERETGAHSRQ